MVPAALAQLANVLVALQTWMVDTRPSSMMSPEMLLSEVRADTPDMTAVALTTPSCVGQSLWTVIVMFAECRCGRSHPRSPSQVRSS